MNHLMREISLFLLMILAGAESTVDKVIVLHITDLGFNSQHNI